jgi:flagellar biosynthesis/type III secretory pathway protein FliH
MDNVRSIIYRMESLVDTSKTMPMGGQKIVDARRLKELMDQLVMAIPQEVDAARQLLENKDNLLQQAQSDAKRRRTEAENAYRSRVDENEIVSAAQEKARIIEEEAEQRANKRLEQADREAMAKRAEAYNYALQTLQTLERNLDSVLGTVRNGVGMLTPDSDRTAGVR